MAYQILKPIERKRKLINELIELMSNYKTIALVDITGLRALQFQRLRAKLRDIIQIKVAKNSLIRKAIDELNQWYVAATDFFERHQEVLEELGYSIEEIIRINPIRIIRRIDDVSFEILEPWGSFIVEQAEKACLPVLSKIA